MSLNRGPEDPPCSVYPDPDNNMLNTCQDDYSFDEKDDEPSEEDD